VILQFKFKIFIIIYGKELALNSVSFFVANNETLYMRISRIQCPSSQRSFELPNTVLLLSWDPLPSG